jgi:hypothetical protein
MTFHRTTFHRKASLRKTFRPHSVPKKIFHLLSMPPFHQHPCRRPKPQSIPRLLFLKLTRCSTPRRPRPPRRRPHPSHPIPPPMCR